MPSISKICPFLAHKAPNPSKFLPKPLPNRPKTFPKRPKIHPKGLLGPILDQCFYKIWFWKSKKASKCAQKWPQGCPERPKPFPNWAQHLPKSDFWALLCVFLFDRKFTSILYQFFRDFYILFKEATLKIHAPTQRFVDFTVNSQLWKKVLQII